MTTKADGPDPMPPLYVVVLNWNRPAETLACMEAVGRSEYPDLTVVVVDNHSGDDSVDRIRAAFPGVPLLQAGSNQGYAGGNNLGLRYALARGAAYVVLLNDDVRVQPDTFSRLVAAAADPDVAAVGCKVRIYERPDRLWAAGEGFGRLQGYPLDGPRFDAARELEYAVGCCILLRREALQRIGLLDPAFFAIHEEKDWCRRAREAGYRILYAPDAVVQHRVSTSLTSNRSPTYHYLFVRNTLRILEIQGAIPPNWRRLRGAVTLAWQELCFIRRGGPSRPRRMWAALRGAADYVLGHAGPPPADLRG